MTDAAFISVLMSVNLKMYNINLIFRSYYIREIHESYTVVKDIAATQELTPLKYSIVYPLNTSK